MNIQKAKRKIIVIGFLLKELIMKTVCFLGVDKELKQFVISYFLKKKSVIIDRQNISISGTRFLLNFDLNKHLPERKNVYIFGGRNFSKNISISDESICICLSKDNNALTFLCNKNVNVITCGYSATDTVTFSSLNNTNSLISLQRQIKNLNDEVIEPFDFANEILMKSKENILLFNALLMCF
jgi:hypothetical protein